MLVGVYKEAFFSGVTPLGSHLSEETWQNIWDNSYVDTVNKERRWVEKPSDRNVKIAKTIVNWLQAFAVLGCIMGQKHNYMDVVYNA